MKEANRHIRHAKVSVEGIEKLPKTLPIVEGRLHCLRRVDEQGKIEILNQKWSVTKQLRGQYVWASIETHKQRLRIYHRHSARAKAKLVKEYEYKIGERVEKLSSPYRRVKRRKSVLQIM